MLYCGRFKNIYVENALKYLPDNIFKNINGKIAITVLDSDACRLARKIREHEEVIILSPWIFSFIPAGTCEIDKEYKYFIFCVLHEIAHAFLKHSAPDEVTNEKNNSQEDEADKYAIDWFNSYTNDNSDKGLSSIDIIEIKKIQEDYKKKIGQILNCG